MLMVILVLFTFECFSLGVFLSAVVLLVLSPALMIRSQVSKSLRSKGFGCFWTTWSVDPWQLERMEGLRATRETLAALVIRSLALVGAALAPP